MYRHGLIRSVSIMGFFNNTQNNVIINYKVRGTKLNFAERAHLKLDFHMFSCSNIFSID